MRIPSPARSLRRAKVASRVSEMKGAQNKVIGLDRFFGFGRDFLVLVG